MRRLTPTLLVLLGLMLLPAAASARVVELGSGAEPAQAVCPDNDCAAPGKLTGYQGRSGKVANPFKIKQSGTIVAFTVSVAKPNAEQVKFFRRTYGADTPQVRLAVLRQSKKEKRKFRLTKQSKAYELSDYFGSSPTFALDQPMRVTKGRVIGITIPTWAPIFGRPSAGKNWWRASRAKKKCKNVQTDVQQDRVGEIKTYSCDYFNVRLLYTVTFIPDPQPTTKAKTKKKTSAKG